MPNTWTDITAEIDSIAELKVVEYILRHTWGYQEYGLKKHITIDEFVHGRRRQDGGRMDRGTGLSERAVYDGLRKAVENGLVEEAIDDSDRGRVKKFYSLRMRNETAVAEDPQSLQLGVQSLHPPLQNLHPGPQSLQGRGAGFAPRTEKETLERNQDLSNFERPHEHIEETAQQRREPRASTSGYAGSSDFVAQRRHTPESAPRRQTRPPGTPEEREALAAFLGDFARELGDEAPLASTITRVLTLLQTAQLPAAQWGDVLYQARSITQERTAQIRTLAADGEASLRRKNKMPYFLAVLEDLLSPSAETTYRR
jgi:hypothetical protein